MKNPLYDHFGFVVSYTYMCNHCKISAGDTKVFLILPLLNFGRNEPHTSITDLFKQYFSSDNRINWMCRNNCLSSATCITNLVRCPRNPIVYLTHPNLFQFNSTPTPTRQQNQRMGKSQTLQLTSSVS